jgi:hypothetical protein
MALPITNIKFSQLNQATNKNVKSKFKLSSLYGIGDGIPQKQGQVSFSQLKGKNLGSGRCINTLSICENRNLQVNDMVSDSYGNVYMVGISYVIGDVVLQNLDGSNSSIVLKSGTGSNAFITKYDSTGKCVLGTLLLNGACNGAYATSLCLDGNGTLYIIGGIKKVGTYFNPVETSSVLNLNGTISSITVPIVSNGFVLKYLGTLCVGASSISGGSDIKGLGCDPNNNIYITGITGGTTTTIITHFDGTTSSLTNTTKRAFMYKYSSNGTYEYGGALFPTTAENNAFAMSVTSTALFVVGYVTTSNAVVTYAQNFDGSANSKYIPITTTSIQRPYITVYNFSGECIGLSYALTNVNVTTANIKSICCFHYNNDFYTVVPMNATETVNITNFDGSTSTTTLAAPNKISTVLIRYDSNGICTQAVKLLDATGVDYVYNCSITSDTLYLCGTQISTSATGVRNFDGTTSSVSLSNNGMCYIVQYNLSTGMCNSGSTYLYCELGFNYSPTSIKHFNNAIYISGYIVSHTSGLSANTKVYNLDGSENTGIYVGNRVITANVNLGYLLSYESSTLTRSVIPTEFIEFDNSVSACVNSVGDLIIVGRYNSTKSFTIPSFYAGNQSIAPIMPASTKKGLRLYCFKYNKDGTATGATAIRENNLTETIVVTCTDSLIIVAGSYQGEASNIYGLDGSSSSFTLTETVGAKPYIIIYSTAGECVYGGSLFDGVGAVTQVAAKNGFLYLVGTYTSGSSVALKNLDGTISGLALTSGATNNGFILVYNITTKALVYAVPIVNNSGNCTTTCMYFDNTNRLLICGKHNGSGYVNNFDNTMSSITIGGSSTCFLIEYNTTTGVCTKGGKLFSSSGNSIKGICIDSQQSIHIAGNYSATSTANLYNMDGTLNSTYTLPIAVNKCFLIKINASGTICGSTNLLVDAFAFINSLICTSNDKVYLTGYYIVNANSSITSLPVYNLDSSVSEYLPINNIPFGGQPFVMEFNLQGVCQKAFRFIECQYSNSPGPFIPTQDIWDDVMYLVGTYCSIVPKSITDLQKHKSVSYLESASDKQAGLFALKFTLI